MPAHGGLSHWKDDRMTTYIVRTHTGDSIEVTAESTAAAIRLLPAGTQVLAIEPATLSRAADQQA